MSGTLFTNVNNIQPMIPEDQKKYNYTMMKYAATQALNTNTKRRVSEILNGCFCVNHLPHAKYSTQNCYPYRNGLSDL